MKGMYALDYDAWEYVPILGLYMRNVYKKVGDGKFEFFKKEYSKIPCRNYMPY